MVLTILIEKIGIFFLYRQKNEVALETERYFHELHPDHQKIHTDQIVKKLQETYIF